MDGELAAALLDAAPVGLLVVDDVGTITYASPSVDDLTGYGFEDVVGTNILTYVHEQAVAGMIESVAYVTEHTDEVMGPAAIGFIHADGRLRVMEVTATNRFDDERIGGLVVSVRDHTLHYRINEAMGLYAEGTGADAALEVLAAALLGMPVRGRVAFVDPDDGAPRVAEQLPDDLFGPAPAGSPPRPWEQVRATGEGVFPPVLDAYDETFRKAAAAAGLATVWAVPVVGPDPDGVAPLRAVLVVGRMEPGDPSVNERLTVALVARNAGMLLERDDLVAEIRRSASTDALTGLANRAELFRPRGDGATEPVTALYVDLDGFKPVNDDLGHAAGDAVLVEVARRLAGACRTDDVLGRLGGDEFAVLCWGLDDLDAAAAVADRILAALDEPVVVADSHGDRPVRVGASIGIARSAGVGAGGESLDAVLRRADHALYDAKRAGRARWHVAAD